MAEHGTRVPAHGPCSTRKRCQSHPVPPRGAPDFWISSAIDVSEPVLENARLLVSELVANAVEHVQEDGEIELRVGLAEGVLRVEVLDPGPGFESRAAPRRRPIAAGGWSSSTGWRCAGRWSHEPLRVWFELQLLSEADVGAVP